MVSAFCGVGRLFHGWRLLSVCWMMLMIGTQGSSVFADLFIYLFICSFLVLLFIFLLLVESVADRIFASPVGLPSLLSMCSSLQRATLSLLPFMAVIIWFSDRGMLQADEREGKCCWFLPIPAGDVTVAFCDVQLATCRECHHLPPLIPLVQLLFDSKALQMGGRCRDRSVVWASLSSCLHFYRSGLSSSRLLPLVVLS